MSHVFSFSIVVIEIFIIYGNFFGSTCGSVTTIDQSNVGGKTRRLLVENSDLQTIQLLLTKTENMESRLQKLEACSTMQPVAFTAIIWADPLPTLGLHQIIIFDRVITNVGNALQPASSIFTAPVNGTYFFEVSIGPATTGETDVELVKNGSQLRRIFSHSDTGSPETSTESVVTQLHAGDQVWVRQFKYNHGICGWGHPSFTGFLLKPDC